MRFPTIVLAAALVIPAAASADEVTDALNAAQEAYEAGDLDYALDELAYATQLMNAMQAEGLEGFLPEPLDGWSREISENAGAGMGFVGGGISAEATYSGSGGSFTITMMADNQIVASMGAMLGNAQMMAAMGQIERINRENFLNADGELQGMIGNRVLVQASGGEVADMVAHLETIDFRALGDFGQ